MNANISQVPTDGDPTRPRAQSANSFCSSFKSPRLARFAEATTVNSPIEPPRSSFIALPTNHFRPQPQPSDIGFGYIDDKHTSHVTVEMEDTDNNHLPRGRSDAPLSPPLKSAMKTPGIAPRNFGNIMSPTFREENVLEKRELATEKEQAKDVKIKARVRAAKIFLRSINFACSLIVLSMIGTTFAIFNATKHLSARSNLPPWAIGTSPWPQILLLVIACISMVFCIAIFWSYCRGGHKRAEKVQTYYTVFAVGFFAFSIVMWGIGAGVLNTTRTNSNGQDLWGWSCKENKRKELFAAEVDYALVCRLQNWSLVCAVIEIVVELCAIGVYSFVFYRIWSKRKLRKSMAVRDRARSDLYLAQLRSQSAPNTPGLNGPLSPRDGGWRPPVDYYKAGPSVEAGITEDEGIRYVDAFQQPPLPKPFMLQPPPSKGLTPKMQQTGFTPLNYTSPTDSRSPSPIQMQPIEQRQGHFGAAPGEQVYESVPIPGSYGSPLSSPAVAPRQMTFPR
ncbi:hypothetical protein AUEXF2481DRAFT_34100 [Aureobasidium subglaciale EXF-2481]|uniref:MARVEL domain-containing protein n=1 Tax=Aureobasidium subglaciale (strain EXF-2481) TaxID=1043005 RepID=A0A074Y2Z5_AURSE|nr:uncharacterized protein AUEXF2481DRAFT_34100 [Aureobasidium subglaciale EXF-2481]KAI5195208.1 hypothetical protein E4T38_09203 [Aureobasidium subglaciale]KAI5214320.1 hypothetical protein E4T40_09117 [Aureobasidium subglaciale]KAI5216838.1 hypothetical protein E4T41_09118 [Aureobasidium subglaciale]KAI5254677.1 hypothetical protein E4T46_09110 [Aureobasidium subglaciale]KEQ90319.1 hypothetical protein AUEXF2481DRAFT_34100 [Aureobasidium subglaciale EXF-2481]